MLFKLLILVVGGYFAFSFFRKHKEKIQNKGNSDDTSAVELVKDPICETFVEKDSPYKVKYYNRVYYFCSQSCMDSFIQQNKKGGTK